MHKKLEYVDTNHAAKFFGCSTRRIRTLLAQGRITGKKQGTEWQINWPIQCTFGLRAPLRKFTNTRNKNESTYNKNESEV